MAEPTLKDVAAKSGYSVRTVIKVLNNKDSNVSQNAREAILLASQELNYKPNIVARSLSMKKNKRIAVVYYGVESFFWNEIDRGIKAASEEIHDFGYTVQVFNGAKNNTTLAKTHEEEVSLQRQIIDQLIREGTDVIIISPVDSYKLNNDINRAVDEGIDVITFVCDAPESKRLKYVGIEPIIGGRIAAELLSIFIGGKGNVIILCAEENLYQEIGKVKGFKEKICEDYHDINILGVYNYGRRTHKAYSVTMDVLNRFKEINGIFATNSDVHIVAKALDHTDRAKDIKLVGFDIVEKTIEYMRKGVICATVAQDVYMEGYMSVKSAFEILSGKSCVQAPGSEFFYVNMNVIVKETLDYLSLARGTRG